MGLCQLRAQSDDAEVSGECAGGGCCVPVLSVVALPTFQVPKHFPVLAARSGDCAAPGVAGISSSSQTRRSDRAMWGW